MPEKYIVMERKDLGEDSIVAIPESIYRDGVKKVYENSGVLFDLERTDFKKHEHWGHHNLPIQVVGSLQKPTEIANSLVKDGLETVCESTTLAFDKAKLLKDPAILSQILDYELIHGDIYILHFTGKAGIEKLQEITLTVAYFLAPQDGEVTVDKNQLFIGGKPSKFPKGDFQFAVEADVYEGNVEAFKAGTANLHRKNLKPYSSRGQYGGHHSNGPWIILTDDVSEEQIDHIARFMKIE